MQISSWIFFIDFQLIYRYCNLVWNRYQAQLSFAEFKSKGMVQSLNMVYIVLNINCRSTSLPISDISQPSLGLCRTKLICIHREKGKYHIRLRTDKTHLPRSFSRCHAVGNTKKKHDGQSNRIASKFHFNLLSLCIVWGLLRIDHRQLALALNPTQSRLVNKKIYSTTTFLFFFVLLLFFVWIGQQ